MYPTAPVQEPNRYSTDGHPHPGTTVPAAGHPEHSPAPPPYQYHPQPYLHMPTRVSMRGRTVTVVQGEWTTGLCHCFDDCTNCVITCFCPCITFGQISEIVNRGSDTCCSRGAVFGALGITGFACLYTWSYRSKLRAQHDLPEEPCADCLVHFCCASCALCQEYRELKNRGFDMGIGWEANMDRQKRGVAMAPMVVPGMTR